MREIESVFRCNERQFGVPPSMLTFLGFPPECENNDT